MAMIDLVDSLGDLTNEVGKVFSQFGIFVANVARAHYHLLGKHTFPIEGRYTGSQAPSVSKLNVPGQVILFPVVLGAWLSSLIVVPFVGNTAISFFNVLKRIIGVSLFDTKFTFTTKDMRSSPGKIYGIPGSIVGFLTGFPIAFTIIFTRLFIDSFKTGARAFTSIANVFIHEEDKLPFKGIENDDSRHPVSKYVLGAPGFLIGSAFGIIASGITVIGRTITNNVKSAKFLLISMIAAAVGDSLTQELKGKGLDGDKRHWAFKYILGAEGLIVGAALGSVSVLAIGVARTIGNTAITMGRTIRAMVNGILHPEDRFESPADKRSNHVAYGFGLLGVPLGLAIGVPVSGVTMLGRGLTNAVKSAAYTIITMNRFALGGDLSASLNGKGFDGDKRHWAFKYLVGSPGLIIGGAIGSVSVLTIAAARTIGNSVITMGRTIRTMVNGVLHPEDRFESPLDSRPKHVAYGFGLLGVPLGLAVGVPVSGVTLLGRGLTNSVKSAAYTIVTMNRFALGGDLSASLNGKGFEADKRHWAFKYLIGAPGIVMGGVIGSLNVSAIGIARTIGNSAITMGRTIRTMLNGVLHPEDRFESPEDKRAKHVAYGFGFFGIILGATMGSLIAATTIAGRVLTNSWKSGAQLVVVMLNSVLHQENKIFSTEDARPVVMKYAAGAPGLFLGSLIGSVGMILVGASRLGTNTVRTAVATYLSITNFFINKVTNLKGIKPEYSLQEDTRPKPIIYILGVLGIPLGAIFSIASSSILILWHTANQSIKSWAALSGSMINVAIDRRGKLSGLGDDVRSAGDKVFGALGYVFSVATITPVALFIVLARKVPLILISCLAVAVAPLTAMFKAIGKTINGHRFDAENNPSRVIQAFKNLYSSLNGAGKFNAGQAIMDNQSGKKGPLSFVRKAFSINTKTATEKVMDALLKAYKKFINKNTNVNGVDFFESQQFEKSITKVIEHSYSKNILANEDALTEKQKEVRNIGAFVKEYVSHYEEGGEPARTIIPSKIYSERTLASTFWGKRNAVNDSAQKDEADAAPSFGSTGSPA